LSFRQQPTEHLQRVSPDCQQLALIATNEMSTYIRASLGRGDLDILHACSSALGWDRQCFELFVSCAPECTQSERTTASFAAHLPANDAVGSGAEVQYLISSEVKFRSRKVAEVGTALINSVSTLYYQLDHGNRKKSDIPNTRNVRGKELL